MPTLDEHRRDTRPDWVIDYWAAKEQEDRTAALERCRLAVATARAVIDAEHKRNGLNLVDVQDYLDYAREAVQSNLD